MSVLKKIEKKTPKLPEGKKIINKPNNRIMWAGSRNEVRSTLNNRQHLINILNKGEF